VARHAANMLVTQLQDRKRSLCYFLDKVTWQKIELTAVNINFLSVGLTKTRKFNPGFPQL